MEDLRKDVVDFGDFIKGEELIYWLSGCYIRKKVSWFLGAFAKLRKANVSFVMSVCPSVSMEQLGSDWTDFDETWHLSIFRKSIENIQVSLKFDKNNEYFTWRRMCVYDNTSLNFS
jgi:hypothetical protein